MYMDSGKKRRREYIFEWNATTHFIFILFIQFNSTSFLFKHHPSRLKAQGSSMLLLDYHFSIRMSNHIHPTCMHIPFLPEWPWHHQGRAYLVPGYRTYIHTYIQDECTGPIYLFYIIMDKWMKSRQRKHAASHVSYAGGIDTYITTWWGGIYP